MFFFSFCKKSRCLQSQRVQFRGFKNSSLCIPWREGISKVDTVICELCSLWTEHGMENCNDCLIFFSVCLLFSFSFIINILNPIIRFFSTKYITVGLTKFDTTGEHDTNLTRFLRIYVEYNRVFVIFVLTRLIN